MRILRSTLVFADVAQAEPLYRRLSALNAERGNRTSEGE